jgi:2-(3-amino-3-carboxypropyl)histidine synthase
MLFDLEIENIESWIRGRGYTSVALQLPEGLKVRADVLSERIFKDTGAEVIVLGYPCYGACDLYTDFRRFAQALIHFGHAPIPNLPQDPDVLFVEARADVNIDNAIEKILPELPGKVGLLASVQYIHLLPRAKEIIGKSGKTAIIGKGDGRICYPGQVLGCDCSSATNVEDEVDGFLFLGEGDFHPLAAAFGVKKKLLVLNPVTGEARSVDAERDRILRRRFAAIESARSAQRFMVIVCGKVGQNRRSEADRIATLLRKAGKDVVMLATDEITPQALLPYRVDAFVSTACPRVAMDDQARYPKPMLTVTDAEVLLGIRSWNNYRFDTIS